MTNINDRPLVSVAIATYNQKDFINECIESILAQDYEPLQIVLSDDASTDGTQEILIEYQKKYPEKIKLFLNKENKGVTKNANIAHFACDGKYISWLGGDDIMLPGKISAQVELMESDESCTICYHEIDCFDSETGQTIELSNIFKRKIGIPDEGGIKEVIRYGCICSIVAAMIRKDCTQKHGFDERLTMVSDWIYLMQTLDTNGKFRYIDKVYMRYRKHRSSITHFNNLKKYRKFKQEELFTLAIALVDYPQYVNDVLVKQADLYRELGRYDSKHYFKLLIASMRFDIKKGSILDLVLFILSFGYFKRNSKNLQ